MVILSKNLQQMFLILSFPLVKLGGINYSKAEFLFNARTIKILKIELISCLNSQRKFWSLQSSIIFIISIHCIIKIQLNVLF